MREKLNVVMCEIGKEARVETIEHTLEGMQKIVEGNIEMFDIEEDITIVCNEEGKILGLPLNRAVRDENEQIIEVIAGNFFIVGVNDEGETISLSKEKCKSLIEKFKYPESFYIENNEVKAITFRTDLNGKSDLGR